MERVLSGGGFLRAPIETQHQYETAMHDMH